MYFNTLVIMNEDALGYGNRSRKPSGYCKLTMPNRVSCYVQGLRQLPKGQNYKLYLTSKTKQQSVEVGMIQVGMSGNKETRWVMDPVSINNSGVNAEDIDGAFIMVSGEDIKGQVVPLVGFSSEPYIWKHLVEDHQESVPKKVAAVTQKQPGVIEESELKTKLNPELEVEPKIKAQVSQIEKEEVAQEDSLAGVAFIREVPEETEGTDNQTADEVLLLKEEIKNLKQTIQELREIIETLEKPAITTKEVQEPAVEPKIQNQAPPTPISPKVTYPEPLEKASGINDYINSFLRKFQESEKEIKIDQVTVGEVFKKRIPINPFEAKTGIKWVRVTHDDLRLFPSLESEWINQPLIMDAHRNYKHFILGRDEAGVGYYIGIPGIYDPDTQSPLEIDKIERFSCCHNVPPKAGEAGYWIATI